jgi:hypothetical protein
MVLVELDSVAIRWVRKATVLGATVKRRRRRITFIVTFLCTSVAKTTQKTTDILHCHHSENIKFKLFVSWFI